MVRASTGVSVAGGGPSGENECWGSLYCQVMMRTAAEAVGPKGVIASVLQALARRENSDVNLGQ